MFSTPLTITILGFGAFGQLVATLLAPHAHVSVFERSDRARQAASELGFSIVEDISDIHADIVVLAVPVQVFEQCLLEISPHLRKGQLIIDVCSIKEEPARLMHLHLPSHVEILASHPMFGPQSAKEGTAGSKIVFCPIRGTRWRHLADFLRQRLGFDIIVTTPEEHDRQAARSQGLTHLLARAFATLGEHPKICTRSFELMSEAMALVTNDAPEVFEAIVLGNRHVVPLRDSLVLALSSFGGTEMNGHSPEITTCRPRET